MQTAVIKRCQNHIFSLPEALCGPISMYTCFLFYTSIYEGRDEWLLLSPKLKRLVSYLEAIVHNGRTSRTEKAIFRPIRRCSDSISARSESIASN